MHQEITMNSQHAPVADGAAQPRNLLVVAVQEIDRLEIEASQAFCRLTALAERLAYQRHFQAAVGVSETHLEPVETATVRVLLAQIVSHALIFGVLNASGLIERSFLAADTVAAASLGLTWTMFGLLYAFPANVVNVCPLVVGRRTGEGDDAGARAAAGQAMLLAGAGGAVGIALAGACGIAAIFAVGAARNAALFLATQGLALGPLLGTQALLGYFAGTMRVGLRSLAAVSLASIVVHLALAWLLTGLFSWSLAGAGLARLGAALTSAAAVLVMARGEMGSLRNLIRRPNKALLAAMVAEGSLLGLQQVVAGLLVFLLYLAASRAGNLTAAALTLTHSGVYPLLFCFAWGSAQAVGAAAAQTVGRGKPGELPRVAWRCLGLSAVLGFALPWGAFVAYGKPILAWLVGSSPAGEEVLAASLHLMGLLAVFFLFDFAINFLSALLKAAKEHAYLLKATMAAACAFGLLLAALPSPLDGACLMGAFIAAEAAWAMLLIVKVVTRFCSTPRTAPAMISRTSGTTVPISRFPTSSTANASRFGPDPEQLDRTPPSAPTDNGLPRLLRFTNFSSFARPLVRILYRKLMNHSAVAADDPPHTKIDERAGDRAKACLYCLRHLRGVRDLFLHVCLP
jgi:Na+-driven multidrug efflux pump